MAESLNIDSSLWSDDKISFTTSYNVGASININGPTLQDTIATTGYVYSKINSMIFCGIFTWIDKLIGEVSRNYKINSEDIGISINKKFEQYYLILNINSAIISTTQLNIDYNGNSFPDDQLKEILAEVGRKSFVWKTNLIDL